MRWPTALAVGAVLAAAGVLGAVAPGLVAGVGLPSVLVTLVGLVCAFLAYSMYRSRRGADREAADPPEVETARAFDRPGTDVDDLLAEAQRNPRRRDRRERLTDRLRTDAVRALAAAEGLDEDRARERVADGAWTDDPYAAAFFAGGTPDVPLARRLRDVFAAESRFVRQARHAVAAVERLTEGPR